VTFHVGGAPARGSPLVAGFHRFGEQRAKMTIRGMNLESDFIQLCKLTRAFFSKYYTLFTATGNTGAIAFYRGYGMRSIQATLLGKTTSWRN
jgi:hypothetical protein